MSTRASTPLAQRLAGRARQQRQPSLSAATWAGRHEAAGVGDRDPLGTGTPVAPGPGTQYRIASITKPQVAVAVLALVQQGRLGLGDPMGDHVPDAPIPGATIGQYLAHTSGLVAEIDGPWWERAGGCAWPELVAMGLRSVAAPGLVHHYSNVGYAVLGRLLETIHGRAWDEVLDEVVWAPLGMTRTSRLPLDDDHAGGVAVHPLRDLVHAEPVNDYLAMGPAGELWSTPSDLVRLGRFLAGAAVDGAPLSPDLLATMRRPATVSPGWDDGYGLGLMLADRGRQVFHTGSVPGFTAQLALDPRTGAAAALCGNATGWCGGALDWLAELAADLPDQVPASRPRPLPSRLRALAGLWYRGPRQVLVRVHEESLEVVPTEQPARASRVELAEDGRLVGTSSGLAFGEELVVDPDHPDDPRWFSLARLHHSRQPYDPASEVPGGVDLAGWRQRRPSS